MSEFPSLEPQALWSIFAFICSIPHPSRGEDRLAEAIVLRERKLGLEAFRDGAGNVIVRSRATAGLEGRKGLILQAHLDMVPQAEAGSAHVFSRDPIRPRVDPADPAWLRATGTTLGADDGIGVAAALALAESASLPHGPLELLLTMCEEDGMDGAQGLKAGELSGELLVNLDSEEAGEICIGCAGASRVRSSIPMPAQAAGPGYRWYEVSASGLLGGHSGLDIHLGRGNALRELASILSLAGPCRLAAFEGGSAANAIPRAARAVAAVPAAGSGAWETSLRDAALERARQLGRADPGFSVSVTPLAGPAPTLSLDEASSTRALGVILALPCGVVAMSEVIPGLTGTSSSVGIARLESAASDRLALSVTTMTRSEKEDAKEEIVSGIEALVRAEGGASERLSWSPAWTPNRSSPLLALAEEAYRAALGPGYEVRGTHGGLETALFREVFPSWDMVSIGPTIRHPHSPDEAVNIESVGRFWRLLTEIAARAG